MQQEVIVTEKKIRWKRSVISRWNFYFRGCKKKGQSRTISNINGLQRIVQGVRADRNNFRMYFRSFRKHTNGLCMNIRLQNRKMPGQIMMKKRENIIFRGIWEIMRIFWQRSDSRKKRLYFISWRQSYPWKISRMHRFLTVWMYTLQENGNFYIKHLKRHFIRT